MPDGHGRGSRSMELTLFLVLFALAALVSARLVPNSDDAAFSAPNLAAGIQGLAAGLQGIRSVEDGPRSGFSLPLKTRHGVRARGLLRRELLRNGSLPMGGSVSTGYFYVTLGLGTPTREFSLIIDTGSTITYIPCSDCKHCGKHQDPAFDPSKSSTVKHLNCRSPKCNCGSPSCQCMQGDMCYYSRYYAEKSSSAGFLLEDRLAFPDAAPTPVDIVFGCVAEETGLIYSQQADGIMGMGNNNNAFQSQLVEQKVIDDVFSLCYGFPDGGTMLLGDVAIEGAKEGMQYTPLKSGTQVHYYTAVLEQIQIAGELVDLPASNYAVGYGTVFDSGTTFTYLPTKAFQLVSKKLKDIAQDKGLELTKGQDPQYDDICWKGAPKEWDALGDLFPTLTFEFAEGAVMHSPPYRYLFKIGEGKFCLGLMDNGAGGTLLGGVSVRNLLVQYDRRNQRVGFFEVDCNNLQYEQPEAATEEASPRRLPPTVITATSTPVAEKSPTENGSGKPKQDTPKEEQEEQEEEEQEEEQQKPHVKPDIVPIHGQHTHSEPSPSPLHLSPPPKAEYDEEIPIPVMGDDRGGSMITAIVLVAAVAILAQVAYTFRAKVMNGFRSCAGYQTVPEVEPYSTSMAAAA